MARRVALSVDLTGLLASAATQLGAHRPGWRDAAAAAGVLRNQAVQGLLAAVLAIGFAPSAVHAQSSASYLQPAPQNVVTLQAEASAEVTQDLLSITLAATRDGADAATVQMQLRQALDAALSEARRQVQTGQLDVRTGSFWISPRYGTRTSGGNQIVGWQGRGELVLEGKDIGGISQLAGRLSGLAVARVVFGLSREARDKVEAEVAAQAITRFKQRAERYAQQFGFASYSLREVNVGGTDVSGGGQPPGLRLARAVASDAPEMAQPVEAGKATVTVTVNGSIQLSPR